MAKFSLITRNCVAAVICQQPPTRFPNTSLTRSHFSNPSTKMSSSQKGKKLTPQEEERRREILMRMEMEALGPARIEKLRTTDYRTKKPYVPFATLRLRRLDALAKNGSLSSDEVTKLKAWRCKSFIYLVYPLPWTYQNRSSPLRER